MGQCGKIIFYTTSAPTDPRAQFADLLSISGERVLSVSRTRRPERGWRVARSFSGREQADDFYRDKMSITDAVALFRPNRHLLVEVDGGPMMDRVHTACLEQIPEEVRDDFSPWNLYIGYGPHDLFESAVSLTYIARAYCSVRLFGWGCPSNWPKYREMVFQVPEIIEAKQHFETVLGPLETCAIWSV